MISKHQKEPQDRIIIHNITKEAIKQLKLNRKKATTNILIPKYLKHTDKHLFTNSKDIAEAFNQNKHGYNLKDMKRCTIPDKSYKIPEIEEVSF